MERSCHNKPKGTVIWIGFECRERAATSICTVLTFLCTDEHHKKWIAANPYEKREILNLSEALYVGKEIFEDFLK
jgi:hypothetical protein